MASGKPLISDAATARELVELFHDADIEGSLIRVPASLVAKLDRLEAETRSHLVQADLLSEKPLSELLELIDQARLLARRFTTCVANPPYLGGKAMAKELKDFAKAKYPNTKSDLFAMFIERGFDFTWHLGFTALVCRDAWMFTTRYEAFRNYLIEQSMLSTVAHMGAGAFEEISGEVVQTCMAVFRPEPRGFLPRFIDCRRSTIDVMQARLTDDTFHCTDKSLSEFRQIIGSPLAYWINQSIINSYASCEKVSDKAEVREGMATGCNEHYVRFWWEVPIEKVGFGCDSREAAKASGAKWFPYNKGGESRRWWGNQDYLVDWENDGEEIQTSLHPDGKRIWAHNFNLEFIFKESISWSDITTKGLSVRFYPKGFLFDASGLSAFSQSGRVLLAILAVANSKLGSHLAEALNPTLHFKSGDFGRLPIPGRKIEELASLSQQAIALCAQNDALLESSFSFKSTDLIGSEATIRNCILRLIDDQFRASLKLDSIEQSVEDIVISLFGEFDATNINRVAPLDFLYCPSLSSAVSSLASYALGITLGRYSLDKPGLIYTHAGNQGFDPSQYRTFPADADGILPITDDLYFGDEDTAERLARWVKTVWPNSSLEENLAFIADSLYAEDGGRKPEETPLEAIRRYLVNDFYRDHLQTYKNRPIYWLFTSGKKKAFQALVYLHRYTPNTLSRMRSDYVQPLLGQLQSHLDDSRAKEQSATSTASKKAQSRLTKKLADQYEELLEFDKRLHFYALQGIALDLDDGVKVNYGKFHDPKIGPILAEEKKITGGKDD